MVRLFCFVVYAWYILGQGPATASEDCAAVSMMVISSSMMAISSGRGASSPWFGGNEIELSSGSMAFGRENIEKAVPNTAFSFGLESCPPLILSDLRASCLRRIFKFPPVHRAGACMKVYVRVFIFRFVTWPSGVPFPLISLYLPYRPECARCAMRSLLFAPFAEPTPFEIARGTQNPSKALQHTLFRIQNILKTTSTGVTGVTRLKSTRR